MKSGNAPVLTREPEMGSDQACVTFLSLHILTSMYCTPPQKLIKCQSEVYCPLLLNVRCQNVKYPSSTTLKIKMKVETSIIQGRHLPLSRDPIQPAQPLIINVSMGDNGRSLPEGQKISLSLFFFWSLFLNPFLLLFFLSPPPFSACLKSIRFSSKGLYQRDQPCGEVPAH